MTRHADPRLARLGEFPFRRLARLLEPVAPAAGRQPIDLSIGEPRHAPPPILAATVAAHADAWNRYPPPAGTPEYRAACAAWAQRRYHLPAGALDPDRHVLALAGTKEGLFAIASLLVPGRERPVVLMPSPYYAVYAGAALMAGAEPVLLPADVSTGHLPDLDALSPDLLARTTAFYLTSPANPQGVVADRAYLARALALARRHDFTLLLDECYAELWLDAPPPGGLEVAHAEHGEFRNLLVFHSLSKRSSAPGLRAGFVAGDPALLASFATLRAYAAPVMPLPLAAAAIELWRDEAHVEANRAAYRAKIDLAERLLAGRYGFFRPAAGFFLWLEVGDGEAAARRLWAEAALKVLPGGYLALADAAGRNPSAPFIRLALVHDLSVVEDALARLVAVLG